MKRLAVIKLSYPTLCGILKVKGIDFILIDVFTKLERKKL